MNKKSLFTACVLVMGGLTLSCVSPFYGTARIEEGWEMDLGVAGATFVSPVNEWFPECIGGRADYQVRYGFNRYLQVNGRIGAGLGYRIPTEAFPPPPLEDIYPLVDGAIGVQGAYSLGSITPSLRIEVGEFINITPLVGFGQSEWLTLGGRFAFLYAEGALYDVFLTLHPVSRWSFFAGANLNSFVDPSFLWEYPLISVGAGYHILK